MDERIQQAIAYTEMTRDRLIKTLSFIPGDRLSWKPAPTSPSALEIVNHVVTSSYRLAAYIRGGAPADVREATASSTEEAGQLVQDSAQAVLGALEAVNPDRLGETVQLTFAEMPMSFLILLPARHMDNHGAQIDYLQTMWGDTEFHR